MEIFDYIDNEKLNKCVPCTEGGSVVTFIFVRSFSNKQRSSIKDDAYGQQNDNS